jgi:hypothetical protein
LLKLHILNSTNYLPKMQIFLEIIFSAWRCLISSSAWLIYFTLVYFHVLMTALLCVVGGFIDGSFLPKIITEAPTYKLDQGRSCHHIISHLISVLQWACYPIVLWLWRLYSTWRSNLQCFQSVINQMTSVGTLVWPEQRKQHLYGQVARRWHKQQTGDPSKHAILVFNFTMFSCTLL